MQSDQLQLVVITKKSYFVVLRAVVHDFPRPPMVEAQIRVFRMNLFGACIKNVKSDERKVVIPADAHP